MSFETSDRAFKLFTEAYGKAWSAPMPSLKMGEPYIKARQAEAIPEKSDGPSSGDEAPSPPRAASNPRT